MLRVAFHIGCSHQTMYLFTEIHEANWLTLPEDLGSDHVGRYDAVLCLGNSFAHMPDADGNLTLQKTALESFKEMLNPGGILIIDHRNFDVILDSGEVPKNNMYYNVSEIVS